MAEKETDDHDSFMTTEAGSESAGKAFVQIALGAVVFAALTGAYLWNANRAHSVDILLVEARPLVEAADVASLKAAQARLEEAQGIKSNEKVLALLAELHTLLWVKHGVQEAKGPAESYVSEAESAGVQRAERYASRALLKYKEGDAAGAAASVKEVIAKGAVSDKLYYALGLSQVALGDLKDGRDNLLKARNTSGSSPHYNVDLGDVYDLLGDRGNATTSWLKAQKANSAYVPAAARHLMVKARKNETLKGLKAEIDRIEKGAPDGLPPLDKAALEMARAQILIQFGKTGAAVKAIEESLKLDPKSALALHIKARALFGEGKAKLGLKAQEAARAAAPGSKKYLYELATAYGENSQGKKAIEILNKAPEKEALKDTAEYHVQLANAFMAAGNMGKAHKSADAALKIRAKDAEAQLAKGTILWREKKYDDALKWFEKAINARSNFPELYRALGLMWVEQGASAQAMAQLEQAEKQFKSRGLDAVQMQAFYGDVIKTLAANGGSSYVSAWASKEKALRTGS